MFSLLERWALRVIEKKLRKHPSYSLDVLRELWPGDYAISRPIYTVGDMEMHGRRIREEEKTHLSIDASVSSLVEELAYEKGKKDAQAQAEEYIRLAYIAGLWDGARR